MQQILQNRSFLRCLPFPDMTNWRKQYVSHEEPRFCDIAATSLRTHSIGLLKVIGQALRVPSDYCVHGARDVITGIS